MYYCGWDGGGTKTQVCLMAGDGSVRGTAHFGPLNPNGAAETVRATVSDCLRWMREQTGDLRDCGGLVIGIAGVSNANAARLVADAVTACGYAGPLRLMGDQEIALAGAVEGPGAVLIAGTGTVCYGRDAAGHSFRSGGYGHLIDDGGSGYAIGRDILTAVVRAADGRGPETCLTQAVFDDLRVSDIGAMITWLYRADTGKKQIAALAPLLLPALEKEDAAALAIARRASEELAALVIAAWKKAGLTGGEVALCGSVFKYFPAVKEGFLRLLRATRPDIAVIAPRAPASVGAARLAMAERPAH